MLKGKEQWKFYEHCHMVYWKQEHYDKKIPKQDRIIDPWCSTYVFPLYELDVSPI